MVSDDGRASWNERTDGRARRALVSLGFGFGVDGRGEKWPPKCSRQVNYVLMLPLPPPLASHRALTTDVNDHAPEFQNVPYHLEVDEVS